MNTLTLELDFDEDGKVFVYRATSRGTDRHYMVATSLTDPVHDHISSHETTIAKRVIGAINTEFDLPPIPGMKR